MLGNKQQGAKGILFTARYVERFNKEEVEIIKNDTGSYRSLAEKYNISIGTIYKIKNNKY